MTDKSPHDAARLDPSRLALRILLVCLGIQLLFVLLDALINYGQLAGDQAVRKLFNLAREDSFPTWFASAQALLTGLAACLIAYQSRGPSTAWGVRYGWGFIGAFFIYLSADDATSFHERMGSLLERHAAATSAVEGLVSHYPSYTWQLIFLPVFALIAVFLMAFLWQECRMNKQRMLMITALCCFALAILLDYVEGVERLESAWATALGVRDYTVEHFAKVTEELLEMIGVACFLALFAGRVVEGFEC